MEWQTQRDSPGLEQKLLRRVAILVEVMVILVEKSSLFVDHH